MVLKKMIKIFLYFLMYPLIFFIEIIKPIKFIKFCLIKSSYIGTYIQEIDAYLYQRDQKKFENCKIIFFEDKMVCNLQISKMSRRLMHVRKFSLLLKLIHESLEHWKKTKHLLYLNEYWTRYLPQQVKINKSNNLITFTKKEIIEGEKLLEDLLIPKNNEWICIANRDSSYKKKYNSNFGYSYHDHRNFSVNLLNLAAEYFANKGYYVIRMGSIVNEKLDNKNKKIIDYSNSNIVSDFADIFLLKNCKAYFGSDTGINAVSEIYGKKVFFVNFSSTQLHTLSKFNYLTTILIKRIGDKATGKLLSIKEILQSKFAYSVNFDDYKRCGALPVNNTSEEIKNFAEEVCNIIEGKKEEKEDIEIKDAFWRTYTSYVHKDKIGPYKVNLGANFLRKNIDLIK